MLSKTEYSLIPIPHAKLIKTIKSDIVFSFFCKKKKKKKYGEY